MKKSQKITIAVGIFILILFSPAASFIFNFGTVVGMLFGIIIIILGAKAEKVKQVFKYIKSKGWGKALLTVFIVLCSVVLIYCSVATFNIISYSTDNKNIPKNTPVIVLGCKVMGTQPGPMLTKRCKAACEYLSDNPEAICIVSGGQGADEEISEADAMYTLLCEMGVSPDRIFKEDKSHNTAENFRFSKEILREQGCGNDVVVVTTNYHQYRASLIARRQQLNTYAVSSKTGNFSLPTYIVREWFSLILVLIRK